MYMRKFLNSELKWYRDIGNNGFFIYFEWDSDHFLEKTFIDKTVDKNKNKIDDIRISLNNMYMVTIDNSFYKL